MKILPVAAELFHANRQKDRQTEMTKLIDTILNFAKAREKREIVPSYKYFESFNETNSI
jgi:hypothetical protein